MIQCCMTAISFTLLIVGVVTGPRLLSPIHVLKYALVDSWPQSLRTTRRLAMEEFSVKSFALFVCEGCI